MNRGKASGFTLTKRDAGIVLGMVARGDRHHDIAAWFGVNQGRIAEVQDGDFGTVELAPPDQLPPKGAPGVKGKRLYQSVKVAIQKLQSGEFSADDLVNSIQESIARYESHEM